MILFVKNIEKLVEGMERSIIKFANFPTTMTNGQVIWLEKYTSNEVVKFIHYEAGTGYLDWVSTSKIRLNN